LDHPVLVLKLMGTGIPPWTQTKTHPNPMGIPLPMQYTIHTHSDPQSQDSLAGDGPPDDNPDDPNANLI